MPVLVLSAAVEAHITSQHTAPSTMESVSGNSNPVADAIIQSGTNNPGLQSRSALHLMDKAEENYDAEDISAATDDDVAPGMLLSVYASYTNYLIIAVSREGCSWNTAVVACIRLMSSLVFTESTDS